MPDGGRGGRGGKGSKSESGEGEKERMKRSRMKGKRRQAAVSYTHLTLPTKLIV